MFSKQEKLLFQSQSSDHLRIKKKEENAEIENGPIKKCKSLQFLPIVQKGRIPGQLDLYQT
jgi:hypothetical protein